MEKIKLSIIIPAYNAENSIERCLKSIINQINKNTEVIIINDGSTDKTDTIINNISSNYSNIFYIKQKNSGVSFTRNRGIEIAKGEYIWFIDSDDYISDGAFEKIYKCLNANDLVLLNYELIGDLKKDILKKIGNSQLNRCEFLNFLKENLFTIDMTVPWNKIFKREIILKNEIKFDEKLYSNEDFLFNLNYYTEINSIFVIKEELYTYIVDQANSLSKRERSLKYSWDVTKKLYEKICILYNNEPIVCNNFLFERCYNDMMCSKFNIKELKLIMFNDSIFKKDIFLTNLNKRKSRLARFVIKYKLSSFILLLIKVKKSFKR